MKKLIITLLLLILFKSAFAQLSDGEAKFDFFSFSGGVGKPFVYNNAFDSWTELNYHRKINNYVEGYSDFSAVLRDYDFGGQVMGSSGDFAVVSFYAGRRISPLKSVITSFINVGWGGFSDDIYSLSPVNYIRLPDEVGQKMELKYNATFLSLSSKNYINNLGFSITKNKRLFVRTGFYVDFNYRTGGAVWQYGYNKTTVTEYYDDGGEETSSSTKFVGHNVYSVPALANKFFDGGVFIAITLSTLLKKQ